ncbi:MAG: phage holin family protein [Proteobacteria bacterium]|nr:phage holin family protein [Pseudomonadota bacterium]HQR03622.1 phage holin family protein [Rhodocyclaceae bacterium]
MSDQSRPGLLRSARDLLSHSLELVQVRAELLATEAEEELRRVLQLLVWGALALLLLVAGTVFLAILLTVLLWDQHRLLALGLFSGIFLTAGLAALLMARHHAHDAGRLFGTSLDELARDREALIRRP